MEKRISIGEWQGRFEEGLYDASDTKTQIEAGWYDWFCRDASLRNKTKKMGNIIKQIRNGGKVDTKNWYAWFKNNCPLTGPLYDDFRLARRDTGDVQMTIQIDCCWNKRRYSVWGRKGEDKEFEHEEALFETDSQKGLVKWLNTPWEETK